VDVSAVDARRGPGLAVIAWRAMVVVVGCVALACGYFGLHQYLRINPDFPSQPTDLLYYDFQLFVLSSPPIDNGHTFPPLLQFARFAAPSVTVYALLEAGRRLFAAEIALQRTSRARRHHVVCGDGAIADALAARLAREGRRVVRVRSRAHSDPRRRRSLLVLGDPTSTTVLIAAGVQRARMLYVCTTDSAINLAVALAVSQIGRRGRGPLDVHVQIDDPELCLALQARRLDLPPSRKLQVNFFSSHELAARTLLANQPPPEVTGRSPQFMIVGASPFGTALAVELARYWRGVDPQPRHPIEIIVVDIHADAAIDRLERRYPFLADICEFTSHEVHIESLLDGDLPDVPPDRVYLCGEDEEVALKLALTMDHFWRRGPRSVVVRLSRLGLLDKAFHATYEDRLLDDVAGTLYLFDAVRAGSDPSLVEDSLMERLGRAIHENYVAIQLRQGADLEATRAMRRWAELSDDLREANRAQAADVGRKLRAIGCVLAPSPIWGEPELLDLLTIERLARMEHERWCAYMGEAGWRYAPDRDDDARLHPDLVDWLHLAEQAREKDREAVREMPAFLADVGFQIVRVPTARVPSR
jgi:hypothetical protein